MAKTTLRRELLGRVGVDSGQLMIMDPCYISNEWIPGKYDDEQSTYRQLCKLTAGPKQGGSLSYKLGHEGLAVTFCSGFGDGTYGVWATYKDFGSMGGERIVKVEVILIDEDGDESTP